MLNLDLPNAQRASAIEQLRSALWHAADTNQLTYTDLRAVFVEFLTQLKRRRANEGVTG